MSWKQLNSVTSSIVFNKDDHKTDEKKQELLNSIGDAGTEKIPRGRSSHSLSSASLSNGQNLLILFGGEDIPRHPIDNTVWVFNLNEESWSRIEASVDSPSPRLGHVAQVIGDHLWIFGGRNAQKEELNDLYSLDLISKKWQKHVTTGDIPPGRSYGSSDVSENDLVVFSGCGTNSEGKACRLNDIFILNTTKLVWKKLGVNSQNAPTPRGGSNISVIGQKAYVFGGFSGKQLDDLWCFDFVSDSWQLIDSPSSTRPGGRSVACGHKLSDGTLFVFGGEKEAAPVELGHLGAGLYFDDSFIYDPKLNSWKNVICSNSITPRGWVGSCSAQKKFYIFGGFDGNARINDLYELNL